MRPVSERTADRAVCPAQIGVVVLTGLGGEVGSEQDSQCNFTTAAGANYRSTSGQAVPLEAVATATGHNRIGRLIEGNTHFK
jgi:hypothetical protein